MLIRYSLALFNRVSDSSGLYNLPECLFRSEHPPERTFKVKAAFWLN